MARCCSAALSGSPPCAVRRPCPVLCCALHCERLHPGARAGALPAWMCTCALAQAGCWGWLRLAAHMPSMRTTTSLCVRAHTTTIVGVAWAGASIPIRSANVHWNWHWHWHWPGTLRVPSGGAGHAAHRAPPPFLSVAPLHAPPRAALAKFWAVRHAPGTEGGPPCRDRRCCCRKCASQPT